MCSALFELACGIEQVDDIHARQQNNESLSWKRVGPKYQRLQIALIAVIGVQGPLRAIFLRIPSRPVECCAWHQKNVENAHLFRKLWPHALPPLIVSLLEPSLSDTLPPRPPCSTISKPSLSSPASSRVFARKSRTCCTE